MSIQYQRLIIIFFSLILVALAIFLILFNSKKNFVFFLTPTELINTNDILNKQIRIGGYVKEDSIIVENNSSYIFILTDKKNEIKVKYSGILPDLFREGQGAVIEGNLKNKNQFLASRIFTKHDENYMPASIKNQLQQKNYWKKEY